MSDIYAENHQLDPWTPEDEIEFRVRRLEISEISDDEWATRDDGCPHEDTPGQVYSKAMHEIWGQ